MSNFAAADSKIHDFWLVVTGTFVFFSIYWEQSSQLTTVFQRAGSTTNQFFPYLEVNWLICSSHFHIHSHTMTSSTFECLPFSKFPCFHDLVGNLKGWAWLGFLLVFLRGVDLMEIPSEGCQGGSKARTVKKMCFF